MNTEELILDFDLTPGVEKRIFILGINNGIGQAVLKKLHKNKKLKICAFYLNEKDKDLLKDESIIYKDIKVFLDVLLYSLQTKPVDFIINCLDIDFKALINSSNEITALGIMQYYFLALPQIMISNLIKHNFNTKIINYTNLNVFSQIEANKEYNELDSHDSTNKYGKLKSLGELNIKNFYNLRCDLIGSNVFNNDLIKDFFNKENNAKFDFENKTWNGITTLQFAKIIENIIFNDLQPSYIQHLFSNKISTYQLLKLLNEAYDKNLQIDNINYTENGHTLNTINSDFHEELHGGKIPSIESMIKEMKEFDSAT